MRDEPIRPELSWKLDEEHMKDAIKEARKIAAAAGKPHNAPAVKAIKKGSKEDLKGPKNVRSLNEIR